MADPMLEIQKFQIEGLQLLTPKSFHDDRGFFVERYNEGRFREAGLPTVYIQDNFSHSAPGTVRGLHYQFEPTQLKLVSCLRGSILDVALDLRKNSPTFGQHQSVILTGEKPQWLLIPGGFAHGFSVISKESADVMYKVDKPYSAAAEGAIRWNDPQLAIAWNVSQPLISPKDQLARSWKEFLTINPF